MPLEISSLASSVATDPKAKLGPCAAKMGTGVALTGFSGI